MGFLFIIIFIGFPLIYMLSLGGLDLIVGIVLLCLFIGFCFNIKKHQKANDKKQKKNLDYWEDFYSDIDD